MKLLDALNWRYGVKQFSDEKVSAEELQTLLEATRLSPSAYGLQPYKIIVIESKALRAQLVPFSYGQNKVLESSHLVVFAAANQADDALVDRYINKYLSVTNQDYSAISGYADHMKSALAAKTTAQQQEWAKQQAYIALGNFVTSAALLQIDACPMTGIDVAGYDQVLGLTELGLTTTVICPIGRRYQDDQQAHRPKVRFDYDDIIWEFAS